MPRVYKYRHTLLAAFLAGRVDHDEYLRQLKRLGLRPQTATTTKARRKRA